MITVNKETGTIEITETLTYEYTVKPIFEEEFEYLEERYLIDDVNEDDPDIKEHGDELCGIAESAVLRDRQDLPCPGMGRGTGERSEARSYQQGRVGGEAAWPKVKN